MRIKKVIEKTGKTMIEPRKGRTGCWLGMLAAMAMMCVAVPLGAQTQADGALEEVRSLVRSFEKLIPYTDTVHHYTLTHVFLNEEYRYLKLTISQDTGTTIAETCMYDVFDYLVSQEGWTLKPLVDNGFELRLNLWSRNGAVSAQYRYSAEDMKQMLPMSPEEWFVQLAVEMQKLLPRETVKGMEVLKNAWYSSDSDLFVIEYEFPDQVWAGKVKRTVGNTDSMRLERMKSLIADPDRVDVVEQAMRGKVTLQYQYYNQSHTDTVKIDIKPMDWELFIEMYRPEQAGEEGGNVQSLIYQFKIGLDQLNSQCPMQVDDVTVMDSCVFDTAMRVVTYYYSVSELAMLNLEHNAEMQQVLRGNIASTFVAENSKEYMALLADEGVTLVFQYASPRAGKPVIFAFSPEDIREILKQ